MKQCSEAAINIWEWITDNRIRFIWGSELRLHTNVSWGTAETKKTKKHFKFCLFLACLLQRIDTHLQKLGELWDTFPYSTCIFFQLRKDGSHSLKCTYITLYLSFYCILQCNAFFFLRAYCLATRGGAMWRALYEWSYNLWMDISPSPAKHKHLSVERKMHKRLKHSTVHGSMSALFL